MDDSRQTMDDSRQTMDDGRWTTDDGRRTTDDERRTMNDGRWTTDELWKNRISLDFIFLLLQFAVSMKPVLILLLLTWTVYAEAQPVKGVDYLAILKSGAAYSDKVPDKLPSFTYQSSNDPALVALRKNFNLDSVAGFGNEASRLLNLLHWVHNTVPHNGSVESGIRLINANEIISVAKTKRVGVSCGELATTLNDVYLAMGWNSRKIYCFPKDSLKQDNDSHVINAVYLSSKNKWIWVDPTNDAYVMDEKGELLSIEEVRERLINGKPLIVNPDANWNRRSSMTKDYYLDIYMAKNLYKFYSPLRSEFNYENRGENKKIEYVYLNPVADQKDEFFKTSEQYNADAKTTFTRYYIHNEKLFWKTPRQ